MRIFLTGDFRIAWAVVSLYVEKFVAGLTLRPTVFIKLSQSLTANYLTVQLEIVTLSFLGSLDVLLLMLGCIRFFLFCLRMTFAFASVVAHWQNNTN